MERPVAVFVRLPLEYYLCAMISVYQLSSDGMACTVRAFSWAFIWALLSDVFFFKPIQYHSVVLKTILRAWQECHEYMLPAFAYGAHIGVCSTPPPSCLPARAAHAQGNKCNCEGTLVSYWFHVRSQTSNHICCLGITSFTFERLCLSHAPVDDRIGWTNLR